MWFTRKRLRPLVLHHQIEQVLLVNSPLSPGSPQTPRQSRHGSCTRQSITIIGREGTCRCPTLCPSTQCGHQRPVTWPCSNKLFSSASSQIGNTRVGIVLGRMTLTSSAIHLELFHYDDKIFHAHRIASATRQVSEPARQCRVNATHLAPDRRSGLGTSSQVKFASVCSERVLQPWEEVG